VLTSNTVFLHCYTHDKKPLACLSLTSAKVRAVTVIWLPALPLINVSILTAAEMICA